MSKMSKYQIEAIILVSCLAAYGSLANAKITCDEPAKTDPVSERVVKGRAFIACLKAGKSKSSERKANVMTYQVDGATGDVVETRQEENVSEVDINQKELVLAKDERKKNFTDFDWGLGVGVAFGNDRRVESAVVENGVVRVTEDNTDEARVLLELHKFFTPFKNKDIGLGPFAMITAGGTDGDVLSSFGLGIMLGFRMDSEDSIASKSTNSRSWNLGIGLVLDNNVTVLGDGFTANEAPPEGIMEIRFKEESQDAFAVIFSTTF